ncbi:MAG: VWA domain-containing protein [Armatimonadota bacterium]|nr:VWA domain-containing protein [Armatimonadota bacterium]
MEFTWPRMLWSLGSIPLLLWGYILLGRRRERVRTRLADTHLWPKLWSSSLRIHRDLPDMFYLLAAILFLIGLARPVAAIPLPANRSAIVIAIDTSKSMMGQDLQPDRLGAAKRLVEEVLRTIPRSVKIGLTFFSDYGTVLVRPTDDRSKVREALEQLKPLEGTAIGSAILQSLRVLPDRGQLLEEMGRTGALNLPTGEDLPKAAILLLSDGVSNIGPNPVEAAELAARVKVPIYTVGIGTPEGSVMPYNNQLVLVPFDATTLREIAKRSGGGYYPYQEGERLKEALRQFPWTIRWERKKAEVTHLVAGLAGLFALAGGALSLMWYRRIP